MKISTTIIALLCFVIPSWSQSATEEEAVKQVIEDAFNHIFSELNPDVIEDYFTPDFILLEDGKVWNNDSIRFFLREQVLPHVEKLKEENHTLERINRFDFIKISFSGNGAWVAYRNTGIFKIDGAMVDEVHWLESAVLKKTDKGWRVQLLHSTETNEGRPHTEE